MFLPNQILPNTPFTGNPAFVAAGLSGYRGNPGLNHLPSGRSGRVNLLPRIVTLRTERGVQP